MNELHIIDVTRELLDAAVDGPAALGTALNADIAHDWAVFPDALKRIQRDYERGAGAKPWATVFFMLTSPRTLIGIGGYKGPPSHDGVVEIGYAISPDFRGKGFASQAVRRLLQRGFGDACVSAMDAHTLGEPNASVRVLQKHGFAHIGEKHDPDVGAIWHWRLYRRAFVPTLDEMNAEPAPPIR